jgi:Fe-S-cluster-containing dehydrogenase component
MGLKKLYIDLEKMSEHDKKCGKECSYYYHPENYGILPLQETATYAVICRKCEKENCVTSCPFEALEKGPDKILRRSNLRCTSCKTCSHACHSGVIWPEFIPYMAFNCDLCLDRLQGDKTPECVESCTCGAIQYGDFREDNTKDIYAIGDNIVVHSVHWQREESPKRAHKK